MRPFCDYFLTYGVLICVLIFFILPCLRKTIGSSEGGSVVYCQTLQARVNTWSLNSCPHIVHVVLRYASLPAFTWPYTFCCALLL